MRNTQNPGTVFKGGIPIYVPNEVWQADASFYISYNPSVRDYGCDTTAIVMTAPQSKFYILCGDHREALKQAGTLKACLEYFASLPDEQHRFSDKLD